MIATLLGWIGLPQWALELIALAAVGGSVWLYLHHVYEEGVTAEVAVVAKQAAIQHQKDVVAATNAEHTHDDELSTLRAYQLAHTDDVEPVRLCINRVLQSAPANQTRLQPNPAGASTAVIQPVPPGDNRGGTEQAGVDIFPMLNALAARADEVNAQLRAYQVLR